MAVETTPPHTPANKESNLTSDSLIRGILETVAVSEVSDIITEEMIDLIAADYICTSTNRASTLEIKIKIEHTTVRFCFE